MCTKDKNGALWSIVGSVVGASPIVQYRVIDVGVVVAVAVDIVVASLPTTVGIFSSSTCCASSVVIGGGANFVDELAILLQQLINLRLIFVYLGLLFPDHLQEIVILRRHLLDVLFVGSCRYRYFT